MSRRRGRRPPASPSPPPPAVEGAPGKRYPIRHADQLFRDLRVMIIALATLALVFGIADVVVHGGQPTNQAYTYLLLAAAETAFLGLLYLRKRRSYCALTADALVIQQPFFRVSIPLASLKRVRVQPLKQAFATPDRRRYVNRPTKRLLDTPALYLRFDPRDPVFAAAGRLGGRVVYKDDLVLPLAEAEELAALLRARRVQG